MTVAALLFAHTIPIVITDALISSINAPKAAIETPLTSAEIRGTEDGYVPVGIAQKMWHNRNLVFLYAGTVDHAKRLFRFLDHKLYYGGIDYSAEVHDDLKRYVQDNQLDVSFIVVCRESDDFIHYYSHNEVQAEGSLFGRCIMIGSGKAPLLTLLDKISGTPLPPADGLSDTYISLVFLNALRALAAVTKDYIRTRSILAAKATGGFFCLSSLPGLYGFGADNVPAIMASGICQLFVEVDHDGPYLNRAVISRPGIGQMAAEVIRMDGRCSISASDRILDLPAAALRVVTIGMVTTETLWEDFSPRAGYVVNGVIVYVEKRLSDKEGDIVQQSKIFLNDPPMLSIFQSEGGVRLTATEPFMQSVIERLERFTRSGPKDVIA